jgi:hypothetical protein
MARSMTVNRAVRAITEPTIAGRERSRRDQNRTSKATERKKGQDEKQMHDGVITCAWYQTIKDNDKSAREGGLFDTRT